MSESNPVAGLRVFSFNNGKIQSLYNHAGFVTYWDSEEKESYCKKPKVEDHHLAHPDCECGFYASMDIDALIKHNVALKSFINDSGIKHSIENTELFYFWNECPPIALVSCYGHLSFHQTGVRCSHMKIEGFIKDSLNSERRDMISSQGFRLINYDNWQDIAKELDLRLVEPEKVKTDPLGDQIVNYLNNYPPLIHTNYIWDRISPRSNSSYDWNVNRHGHINYRSHTYPRYYEEYKYPRQYIDVYTGELLEEGQIDHIKNHHRAIPKVNETQHDIMHVDIFPYYFYNKSPDDVCAPNFPTQALHIHKSKEFNPDTMTVTIIKKWVK